MNQNWEKMIRTYMEPVELLGGEVPLYKPKGAKASVWIFTVLGEFPPVPPPLDRHDMTPCGGREITLDISDPEFLIVRKVIGLNEYSHCIAWDKIVDVVFYRFASD